jgi:hypothetical protein
VLAFFTCCASALTSSYNNESIRTWTNLACTQLKQACLACEPRPGWLSFPPQDGSPRRSCPCQPTGRELCLPWWISRGRPGGGSGLCGLRSRCWAAHPAVATDGLSARRLARLPRSLAMASAARSRNRIAQLFVRTLACTISPPTAPNPCEGNQKLLVMRLFPCLHQAKLSSLRVNRPADAEADGD